MYPNKITSVEEFEATLRKMGGVLSWEYCRQFFKAVKKLDNTVLRKFFKQVEKIFENPDVGKHMFSNRKGQQELYVDRSFRLYYSYCEKDNKIVFLEFSHKKAQ